MKAESGEEKMKRKKRLVLFIMLILFLSILAGIFYLVAYLGLIPKTYYTAEDFGITTITSTRDYNNNGIDDYTDILLGAKEEAKRKPKYVNAYYAGGYPPDNEGVCTDMVWRALKHAGYSFKDLIDSDIKEHQEEYPRVEGIADPNIDFRRVGNQKTYLERHCISLTTDVTKIEEWQPGDIVTYGIYHVGIVSDKRNEKGVPYLIHNAGQPVREEDVLERWEDLSGHFRFEIQR